MNTAQFDRRKGTFGPLSLGLLMAAAALAIGGARSAVAQPLAPGKVSPIPRQRFAIDYAVGGRPTQVELWYTDDQSKSWRLYGVDPDLTSPFDFTAPHEGLYGFMVVARNRMGASENDPVPGTAPKFWCFVDWHRPQVQITGPVPVMPLDGTGVGQVLLKPGEPMTLSYTVLDDFLLEQPIRIEYRPANDPTWKTIAVNQRNVGRYLWGVPESLTGPFFLRVTAEDRAGNVNPASSREMEIVRRVKAVTPPMTVRQIRADTPTTAPDSLVLARPDRTAPVEPPTVVPAGADVHELSPAVGIREPVPPPVPPSAEPRRQAPPPTAQPAPAEPPTVAHTEAPIVEPPPAVMSDREALGMLVVQFTAPEPVSVEKIEPTLQQLLAAMQPLVNRELVGAPLGVALPPVAGSRDLVKRVRVYGVIRPGHREPAQAGLMEQIVRDNLGNVAEGVVMTRFEKAVEAGPMEFEPARVAAPAQAEPPPGPAVAVSSDSRPPPPAPPTAGPSSRQPVAPSAPKIDDERVTEVEPVSSGVSLTEPGVPPAQPAPPPVPRGTTPGSGRSEMVLNFGPERSDVKVAPAPAMPPAPIGPAVVPQGAGGVSRPAPAASAASPPVPGGISLPVPGVTQTPTPDHSVAGRADFPGEGVPRHRLASRAPTTAPAAPTGQTLHPAQPGAPPGPTIAAKLGEPSTPTITPVPGAEPTPSITPALTAAPTPTIAPSPPVPPPAAPGVSPERRAAARAAYKQALAAQAAHDLPKAAQLYGQAIKSDPDLVGAIVNLAGVQLLQRDYAGAEVNYRQATNLAPSRANAWFGLGRVQLLRGDSQSAKESLARLLRLAPKDAAAWVLYGDACKGVGELEGAKAAWSAAVSVAPGTAIAKLAQARLAAAGN